MSESGENKRKIPTDGLTEVVTVKRGLHTKLVLIMLLLIISLMTVVGAFLIRGVLGFYTNEFYEQMISFFSMPEFVADLRRLRTTRRAYKDRRIATLRAAHPHHPTQKLLHT